MLVEFTVGNYRSIKDPVTLSAVAAKQRKTAATGKRRPRVVPDEEIAPSQYIKELGVGLLPALGIFGANASGKTNVLRALNHFLRLISFNSFMNERVAGETFRDISPFSLDDVSRSLPTSFGMKVSTKSAIYAYEIRLDRTRILYEHLEYLPFSSGRTRHLFRREWNETTNNTDWDNGPDFKGPHTLLQRQVNQFEPFLAIVQQYLNIEVLIPLHLWLVTWQYLGTDPNVGTRHILASLLVEQPNRVERIARFLCELDTSIVGIELAPSRRQMDQREIYAIHQGEERVTWPFSEESEGTQRLLKIAFFLLKTLDQQQLLLIDELDASLHPHITHALVKLFQDPTTNPRRAQLIFTSHDNTLQRDNLLRRDQIWFTQKRPDQSTDLYCLNDFQPRNDLALDRAYLDGRFGAVPILPSDFRLGELIGSPS